MSIQPEAGTPVGVPGFMDPNPDMGQEPPQAPAPRPQARKKAPAKPKAQAAPQAPQGRPDGRKPYLSMHKTTLTNHEGERVPPGGIIHLTPDEAEKLGKRVVPAGG